MKTLTMRGREVDFTRYLAQHEQAIALGNGHMNARGDLIGRGGVVIKKRETVAAEYHKANPKAVRTVSLKDIAGEVLPSPSEALAQHMADAKSGKLSTEKPSGYMTEPSRIIPDAPPARKRKLSDEAEG